MTSEIRKNVQVSLRFMTGMRNLLENRCKCLKYRVYKKNAPNPKSPRQGPRAVNYMIS